MKNKKAYIKLLVPVGSRRRKLARKIIPKKTHTPEYDYWIKNVEPLGFQNKSKSRKQPLISIVVPCYNTPERYIDPLISAVINQTYSNWQLVLADGSTEGSASILIKELSKKDKRISYHRINENKGIVGNTNEGLKIAKGEYIAFHDHDDMLSPHALTEVVKVINESNPDLVYSDEDKLSDDGAKPLLPFFKPDWSPELLLGVNYITHLVVARKSIIDKIGGLRQGFDGAQDYDFLLRFSEETENIVHIPKMLYHWRQAEGSTAVTPGKKNYADTAGQRALRDAVKRRKIRASVMEIPERPTNYRLKYLLPERQPKVSIIIPFKDKSALLKQCVGSILKKSTYKNYEIVLVSNNSTEPELFAYLDELKSNKHCKVFIWDKPFNYSAVNNYGRSKATGEYLILLNNDTEVITPEWVEELIGVASQPQVGAVGPMLLYPDTGIQHAGVVLGMNTMAGHVFRHRQPTEWTDFGLPTWPRNYLAVTGACLAIDAKKYDLVGGLDEKFIIAGNDVAIGISLFEKGYRNVYWPFARLVHYENVSVGSYNNVPPGDYDHSLTYYRKYLREGDPYFNPNLDLMNEQVGIRK